VREASACEGLAMSRHVTLTLACGCVAALASGGVWALSAVDYIDPLIGTEGDGSEYGGMQPYTCVPFGSFHAVPMTRTNEIGRLSFNASDDTLLGIILTRQPAIWMGDEIGTSADRKYRLTERPIYLVGGCNK